MAASRAIRPFAPGNIGVMIRNCIDLPNNGVGLVSTGDYVLEVRCLLSWAINPATFLRSASTAGSAVDHIKVIKF